MRNWSYSRNLYVDNNLLKFVDVLNPKHCKLLLKYPENQRQDFIYILLPSQTSTRELQRTKKQLISLSFRTGENHKSCLSELHCCSYVYDKNVFLTVICIVDRPFYFHTKLTTTISTKFVNIPFQFTDSNAKQKVVHTQASHLLTIYDVFVSW